MCLEISQSSQGNTCTVVSFLIKLRPEGLQLYYEKIPTQAFACEYCEIFKNSFFYRTPSVAAAVETISKFKGSSFSSVCFGNSENHWSAAKYKLECNFCYFLEVRRYVNFSAWFLQIIIDNLNVMSINYLKSTAYGFSS